MPGARQKNAVVIQFAKAPIPDRVKTRLQPALDSAACCKLHCALVAHTYRNLEQIQECDLQLWVSEPHEFFVRLTGNSGVPTYIQPAGNLGERMAQAMNVGLQSYDRVVLVGSDCPAINKRYIKEALEILSDQVPVVLGPAADGGYALVAMRQMDLRVFEQVQWGSDKVLQQTRERLRQIGWQWRELAVVADIDRPDDLALLKSYPDLADFFSEKC